MAVRTASPISFSAPRSLAALRPAAGGRAASWLADFGVVLAVIGLYFLLRGAAPDRTAAAVALTERLIAFERAIGVYVEPAVQDVSIRSHVVKETANFVYAYLHFPVLAAVAVWLRARDRERFRFVRNVMFVSMAIGLVFYYAAPAAPPRLMGAHGHDLGFVDTVFGTDTRVSYAQPSLILNEYAAIPSFHFGWIVLASAAIWRETRGVAPRTFAVLLSAVMTWAIVASANHLIVDMALGGIVIALAWYAARRIEAAIQTPAPRPARRPQPIQAN